MVFNNVFLLSASKQRFGEIDMVDSGNSLTDMRNNLTLDCLPGQEQEINNPVKLRQPNRVKRRWESKKHEA